MVIKDASVSQIKRPIMVNKQALLVRQGGKEGGLKPIVMVEEYKVTKVDIYPLLSENKSARATLSSWKVLPKWAQGHRWRFSSFDSE